MLMLLLLLVLGMGFPGDATAQAPPAGEVVNVAFPSENIHVFDATSGLRLS